MTSIRSALLLVAFGVVLLALSSDAKPGNKFTKEVKNPMERAIKESRQHRSPPHRSPPHRSPPHFLPGHLDGDWNNKLPNVPLKYEMEDDFEDSAEYLEDYEAEE